MIKLHHINLCSFRVPQVADFYRDILGLANVEGMDDQRIKTSYDAETQFITDGDMQLHLSVPDPGLPLRINQTVNPVLNTPIGHIAFRTTDIEGLKARLDAARIPYADYGVWGMSNWHQIFLYDPSGGVVEVHQVVDDGSDGDR